MSQEEVLQ